MARYKYYTDEKNRKVIAVSTYAGKTVRGTAVASPQDEFDYEIGRKIAKARCDEKIAKKRMNRARDKVDASYAAYRKAYDQYCKMLEYEKAARDQYYDAVVNITDIMNEVY